MQCLECLTDLFGVPVFAFSSQQNWPRLSVRPSLNLVQGRGTRTWKKGLNPKTGNGLDDEQLYPPSSLRRHSISQKIWCGMTMTVLSTYMIDSTLNQIELRSVNGRGRMRQRPWHSPVGGEDRIKKNTIERRLLVVPLAGKHPIKAFYSSWPQESTCFWASLALRQTYSIASNRTSRCLALNRKLRFVTKCWSRKRKEKDSWNVIIPIVSAILCDYYVINKYVLLKKNEVWHLKNSITNNRKVLIILNKIIKTSYSPCYENTWAIFLLKNIMHVSLSNQHSVVFNTSRPLFD